MYTCLCLDHVPTVFPIIEEYSASEIQAVLAERRIPSFLSSWILLEMQIIKIKVHLFFYFNTDHTNQGTFIIYLDTDNINKGGFIIYHTNQGQFIIYLDTNHTNLG